VGAGFCGREVRAAAAAAAVAFLRSRIIDGADAARFLHWLCDAFQQPFLLSLQG